MNRARILLAEDNKTLLELTANMLASTFDLIGIAHDGQELVSKALLLRPDAIVADITTPLLTGIEAVHQLREAGLVSRFVFLTIHNEIEFLHACLEEGALGYVLKSHIKSDLIPAINAAMTGKRFVSSSLTISEDLP